ncbi:hypothetical protein [Arsenophonus nasoniae]|uniref:Uncharacterized protein n=1 Tax=Arsenophonus nasoniae TaxID=638 RepID=A0A4V1BX26_9GAMM|nr:hypothetical protein [Arsenophonus nasoniae]QBY44223.1 hypothetical protein ArsFIN_28000 [Arsenophonus nasoniae]
MATCHTHLDNHCWIDDLSQRCLIKLQNLKTQYHTLKQEYHAQIEAVKLQQQKIDALHQLDIQHTETQ